MDDGNPIPRHPKPGCLITRNRGRSEAENRQGEPPPSDFPPPNRRPITGPTPVPPAGEAHDRPTAFLPPLPEREMPPKPWKRVCCGPGPTAGDSQDLRAYWHAHRSGAQARHFCTQDSSRRDEAPLSGLLRREGRKPRLVPNRIPQHTRHQPSEWRWCMHGGERGLPPPSPPWPTRSSVELGCCRRAASTEVCGA